MKKLALGLILITIAMRAEATEWRPVSTAQNGLVVFYDIDSIRLFPGAAQVWIRFDSSHVTGVPFPEARALWKIDCLHETIATLSATSYASDGSIRATATLPDSPQSYEPIVPQSYAATMQAILCPNVLQQR